MRRFIGGMIALLLVFPAISCAGFLDDVKNVIGEVSGKKLDERTIVKGLKEALDVGTKKAVNKVSKKDGYFGNNIIRIVMPKKMRDVADVMTRIGLKKEVDNFVVSMNRAAEKAAPEAVSIFVDAIKGMTINDARNILEGSDTAATEFFKVKTTDSLTVAFKPIVSSAMNDVGVTREYKNLISKYERVPFVSSVSVDLDSYVTEQALNGLFYMVGEEEKKIRKDPAARVTELLKKVFGGK
ncbi:MAG: DUF4197 domain-containing protein [Nitrospirota bacterium]|nr:MAG: DUF4197 domain-containing protein [Nitrospirota bacterium]